MSQAKALPTRLTGKRWKPSSRAPAAKRVGGEPIARIMTDLLDYHADATALEARAAAANIQQRVFYHMVPTSANLLMANTLMANTLMANTLMARMFERDLSDKTIMAKDFMTFILPVESTDIISK